MPQHHIERDAVRDREAQAVCCKGEEPHVSEVQFLGNFLAAVTQRHLSPFQAFTEEAFLGKTRKEKRPSPYYSPLTLPFETQDIFF